MTTKHHRRLTLQDIFDALHARLPDLRKRYGVRSLGVFGSYVRGEQRRGSDVDVLIEFDDDAKPGLFWFINLQDELSNALGVKVDLVEKKGLKPYIGKRILEEVICISETDAPSIAQISPRKSAVLSEWKREIRDYLNDILYNIDNIQRFTGGIDFQSFVSDRLTTNAVLQAHVIIGRSSEKIPPDIRSRHPEVPWRRIINTGNSLVHEYYAVDLSNIWRVIQQDLPRLQAAIAAIWLKEEQGHEGH